MMLSKQWDFIRDEMYPVSFDASVSLVLSTTPRHVLNRQREITRGVNVAETVWRHVADMDEVEDQKTKIPSFQLLDC